LVEGQIEGAVALGLGYALFEDVLLDRIRKGVDPQFPGLQDRVVPGCTGSPPPLNAYGGS
jgi:hypothetical protein